MEMSPSGPIVPRDEIGFCHRVARIALFIYLSPVILVVLAIGLIGVVATDARASTGRVSVEDAHPV